MRVAAARRIVHGLSVVLLAGCSLLAAPDDEAPTAVWLLDAVPADLPQRPRGAATLIVFEPETRPVYDTTQMAYALRPPQIAWFARNAWAETPGQMLQPLLLRTLEGTGAFAAVLRPPRSAGITLGLRTDVMELLQDFSVDPPVLRLALRARLTDEAGNRTLAVRTWTVREPMQDKSPRAGVRAADAALARVLRELAEFVLERAP